MAYKAFISYSHTDEAALATAIQYALQHLAKPWYRLRTMAVFRDQTDLSASPGLWSSIERALATSDFFILVTSPRAAQSPWIAKEVQWWLTNRSVARLLIVLADGTLTWDAVSLGFDAKQSTSLPACLLRAFPEEPLYVDCRFARTAHSLSVRNPQFRDAILDLGATLLGRPKSELDSQDLREFRRTRRVLIAAVIALSVLSAMTALEAHLANQQRDAAVAASLSIRAESLLGGNPELALLLARKAFELEPSDDAAHTLRHALSRNPERLFHLGTADVPVNAKFAGSSAAFIAATSQAGPLAGQKATVWDGRTGGKLAELPLEVPGRVEPSSSPDGTRVALEVDEKRFAVYDTHDWHSIKVLEGQEPRFSPDGHLVVGLLGPTGLRTWDAKTLNTLQPRAWMMNTNCWTSVPTGQWLSSRPRRHRRLRPPWRS